MNRFVLFLVNMALGLSMAIRVLIDPALDSSAKTMYLIAAVVFINWAIFTWLAYSSAMKEKQLAKTSKPWLKLSKDVSNQENKTLLDVMTLVYMVVILLALISLNVLAFLGIAEASCLVWIFLTAIFIPLLAAWIANRKLNTPG